MIVEFNYPKAFVKKQAGVVLFTVLVFLVALTLLALTSLRGSTLGERLARNSVDKTLATQAAEAALRDAQADILWVKADGTTCPPGAAAAIAGCRDNTQRPIIGEKHQGWQGDATCSNGQCFANPKVGFTSPVWQDGNQWNKAVSYGRYTGANPLPSVSKQPVYLIEGFWIAARWQAFRITAIGYGADQNTQVMVQSVFKPEL